MKLRRCILLPLVLATQTPAFPADTARPKITAIGNVALQAHDLTRSQAFYRDFLGYAEPGAVHASAGVQRFASVTINDAQSVELSAENDEESDRLLQVALITDAAEVLRQQLQAKGWAVSSGSGGEGARGPSFTVRDPDGRLIEFIEPVSVARTLTNPARSMPATRIAPRIRHVGFMVADLAASLKFYVGLLGFQETWRGSSDDKTLSWVNLKVPDGDEYLELMLYDPALVPDRDRRGVLNHICLEVGDVTVAEQTLRTRSLPDGCKPLSAVKTGRNGKRQINAYDPDGTRTEIMEPGTYDGHAVASSPMPPPGRAGETSELIVRVSESADQIMKVVQPAFEAARGGMKVKATVNSTAKVMEALGRGEVPAAFITRNVRAGDLALATDFVGAPVGLDAIVLAVPVSNPVANLTVEQVRAIWTGEIVNWQQLGGPDLAIIPLGRPKAYDRIQLFGDFIKLDAKPVEGGLIYRDKAKDTWCPTVVAAPPTDDLALATLRDTPGAITYFPAEILGRYTTAGLPVKGLALNGVTATPARIADGGYFIHRTVNVVTKGPPGAPAQAFIAFLLSPEGQKLMTDAGFLRYTP